VKDAFLAEIRAGKPFFYNTVVAQAQRIDVDGDRITFAFLPAHRALRDQFEQTRPWLESLAGRVAGRRMTVGSTQSENGAVPPPGADLPPAAGTTPAAGADLKAEALSSSVVQAMLDVFPGEIRDVEEM
jgi:hypothetical protein